MRRLRIVMLDAFPLDSGDVSWEPLKRLGDLELFEHSDPGAFARRVAGADVVLSNKAIIGDGEIPALGACGLVGVMATGANVLDLPALERAGILAVNVPSYGVEDVAQQALALLLELARQTVLHSESVKAGEWRKRGWCYWLKPPLCLAGLALGIAGLGAIGRMMGKYGSALGMEILAWSRSRKPCGDYGFEYVDLPQLMRRSDVISLHCPLAPGTKEMINASSIAAMKDGVIIINTARGGLVNEADLAAALRSGKVGGYGADVLAVEPALPGNPLLSAPNTLITPHMAWATRRARQRLIDIMAENVRAWLDGAPQNAINKPERPRDPRGDTP